MGTVFILQMLVVGFCNRLVLGATLDACMLVLLSEEFHSTCSTLGRNHTRPCLVQSDQDVAALKRAKVVRRRMSVPRNKICAARTETGEADCVSVHLTCSSQQSWQWTEWTGTSPNIARRFTVTDGNSNRLCPYEEKYFAVPSDCLDAYNKGMRASGVYTISPDGNTELQVYCDQELKGGGWTVFQRRQSGEVNFKRTWAEYREGFGDLQKEHWLGNDFIHLLTKHQDQGVMFALQTPDDQWAFAYYSLFWIEDASQKYRLHIGGFDGSAVPGNSMRDNGRMFSTKDQDNDTWGGKCAVTYHGGWWYGSCHGCNPNGDYGNTAFGQGLTWDSWKGQEYSMAYTAIMLRRNSA